jgi:hypothetical protein
VGTLLDHNKIKKTNMAKKLIFSTYLEQIKNKTFCTYNSWLGFAVQIEKTNEKGKKHMDSFALASPGFKSHWDKKPWALDLAL